MRKRSKKPNQIQRWFTGKEEFVLPCTLLAIAIILFLVNQLRLTNQHLVQNPTSPFLPSVTQSRSPNAVLTSPTDSFEEPSFVFNDATKTFQVVDAKTPVYAAGYSIGLTKRLLSGELTTLIPVRNNESFKADVSPTGRYILYSVMADSSETSQESPLQLYDLTTNTSITVYNFGQDLTYFSMMYWSSDEEKVYYALRQKGDLHFPDPENTFFYRYNLITKSNEFIGKASEYQTGSGHISVAAETKDKASYYVEGQLHGEGNLVGVWKVDANTHQKTPVWLPAKDEYTYIRERSYENHLVLLQKYTDTANIFFWYDLNSGKKTTVPDDLKQIVVGGNTLTTNTDNTRIVIKTEQGHVIEEYDPPKINELTLFPGPTPNQVIIYPYLTHGGVNSNEYEYQTVATYDMKGKQLRFHKLFKVKDSREVWVPVRH